VSDERVGSDERVVNQGRQAAGPARAVTGAAEPVRVNGLLFDSDGVLLDSTAEVEASWRAFAGWYDLPVDDVLARVHGRRSRDIIAHYADRLPVPVEEAFGHFINACVNDQAEVGVLPGAAELLAWLPARGWAVVTSATRAVAQARLAGAGLAAPPVLVAAEDVAAGKPDPAPYRVAAHRLGLDPSACLAIEDAPSGLASARAAGCRTLALLTTHPAGDLPTDLLATDLSAVRVDPDGEHFRVSVEPPAPDRRQDRPRSQRQAG
jgi:sugar-phosphatase